MLSGRDSRVPPYCLPFHPLYTPAPSCRFLDSQRCSLSHSPIPKVVGSGCKGKEAWLCQVRGTECNNDNFPLYISILPVVLFCLSTYPIPWNDPECHSQQQAAPFVLGYIHGRGGFFPWPRRGSSLDQALGPMQILTWASRSFTPHIQ